MNMPVRCFDADFGQKMALLMVILTIDGVLL